MITPSTIKVVVNDETSLDSLRKDLAGKCGIEGEIGDIYFNEMPPNSLQFVDADYQVLGSVVLAKADHSKISLLYTSFAGVSQAKELDLRIISVIKLPAEAAI